MRMELGTRLSGFDESEGEHGDLLGLEVNRQLEAIRKQRLHHQAHLVFGRIALRPRMNFEAFCCDPLRQMGKDGLSLLPRLPKFVCKLDVDHQWKISREEARGGGVGIVTTQRKVWGA